MKCHTNPITFLFFISLSLSAVVSALQFVEPHKVKKDDTYSLTLSTNPTRVLDSKYGKVAVETFDAQKSYNAEDVGPDNGKRWRFKDDMKSLFCEGGGRIRAGRGGYVVRSYTERALSTNGFISLPLLSNIKLIPAGGGIKIKIYLSDKKHVWLDESGNFGKDGAVWMITKTTNRPKSKPSTQHSRELD